MKKINNDQSTLQSDSDEVNVEFEFEFGVDDDGNLSTSCTIIYSDGTKRRRRKRLTEKELKAFLSEVKS